MSVDATGFDPRLGQAFLFDAADLEANRAGRFSPDQELVLRNTVRVHARQASRSRVMIGAAFAIAVAVTAVGIAVTPGGGGTTSAVVAGAILLWVGAIVSWGLRKGSRHMRDTANARVQFVQGDLRVEPAYGGKHYWAYVGTVRFGNRRVPVGPPEGRGQVPPALLPPGRCRRAALAGARVGGRGPS